jgi:hypothetical protein
MARHEGREHMHDEDGLKKQIVRFFVIAIG